MKQKKVIIFWDWIFWIILTLYPLRHINYGLDFWDTGYNYANFLYMGTEHMDSMWLFSTYLANAVGNFFTKLPFGHSLLGMNFYTGLFASALALLGYWFCTRKLNMPRWIVFLGEMVALSLCWCPTALLYNYLTYLLFLVCVILLYLGLTKNNNRYLFFAGICLGANVLVRFSNLPEAALIAAVWVYCIIEYREERKSPGLWSAIFRRTGWCLGGYLAALILLLGYIHFRYGFGNYVEGISRLFGMTENAGDYKPAAMLLGIVSIYVQNLYWVLRLLLVVAVGTAGFGIVSMFLESEKMTAKCKDSQKINNICNLIKKLMYVLWILVSLVVLVWLCGKICSTHYYSYDPILRPGILFLMLTMGICIVRIFHPASLREEKLLSGLVLLVVFLTSLGSNNDIYPSLNNLFVAAPYTLWQCFRFFVNAKEWRWRKIIVKAFPAKGILAIFLGICLFQFIAFGTTFVFAEGTGVREATARVEKNNVLRGIKMPEDRALWMKEISAYVQENQLSGREVILYGQIPAMSFYLEMPSAFNPWSDLLSYSMEAFEEALGKTAAEIEKDPACRPVILVEKKYGEYLRSIGSLEGPLPVSEATDLSAGERELLDADEKWQQLWMFMEEHGYQRTFENEKFVIFE